jgi:glucose-1-phosphate cytidylyltransferase
MSTNPTPQKRIAPVSPSRLHQLNEERNSGIKVVILAGGFGTRLAEETSMRPKPMVEIGGKPILWHIMNIYGSRGFQEFIIACGFKGEVIKEYFHNFFVYNSDLLVNLRDGSHEIGNSNAPDWHVRLVDTGLHTLTAGRLRRLKPYLADETFMVTYGDGVANIDVSELLAFHRAHGRLATVTAVSPPARFGSLLLEDDLVRCFSEKPQTGEGRINGGFFVFESAVLDYMERDDMALEREPLERLAAEGQLMAFRHTGFWHPMDTLRDKQLLESLWASGEAPWMVWDGKAKRASAL